MKKTPEITVVTVAAPVIEITTKRYEQLIAKEKYGYAVAMINEKVSENPLVEVAGKTKLVPVDGQMVKTARDLGISFGDWFSEGGFIWN